MSQFKPSVETALLFGDGISPVAEEVVKNALKSNLPYLPWPSLVPGHRVVVERGPLMGMQGVLLQIRPAHRLLVSINMLQRALAVELDASWIRPARERTFPSIGSVS
jgi:transcription antitermination factor NusG